MRSMNVPDIASLSETVDFGALNVGSPYSLNDIQLGQFARATMVAQGYQFFKIKSLCFKVQPLIDTFIATAPGATQVPYLYWTINRSGNAFPALDKAFFIANGAKGIRLDDKTLTIKYAPNIVVDTVEQAAGAAIANQPNLPVRTPWLTTNREAYSSLWNPSVVSHCGHFMAVYSEGSTQAMNYRLTCTAEIVFKKPLARAPPPSALGAAPVIRLESLLTNA